MERDPTVCLMGEDVGHYGGSYKVRRRERGVGKDDGEKCRHRFKKPNPHPVFPPPPKPSQVTYGLHKKYGDMRLLDTPICENGFMGMGIGAAMTGLRVIIEGMNMGFLLLAYNQISNNAGMLHYTSGGQFKVPVVIRGPGGVGRQLGAEHSQRLESYFQSIPGVQLVACSTVANSKALLKSAIRSDNPVIFFEHVLLYNVKVRGWVRGLSFFWGGESVRLKTPTKKTHLPHSHHTHPRARPTRETTASPWSAPRSCALGPMPRSSRTRACGTSSCRQWPSWRPRGTTPRSWT